MHKSFWLTSLIVPKSRDDDGRRREFILNVLLASSTAIAIVALLVILAQFMSLGHRYNGEPPVFAILQVLLFVGLWVLSRRGLFVPSAYILVAIFLMLAFYMLFGWGIMLPEGLLLLAMALVMSSILLGTRTGAIVTALASTALVLLSMLQDGGHIDFDASWMQSPGGPADAIGFGLTFAVITIVSWLSNRESERFNITLQKRIHQATQRLRTANQNLKVLDKAKDDFISMASHQMGTPLTAISGYLSMALDSDRGNMTPQQREFIGYAVEASERMVAMSLDLLNVSRLSSGKFTIQRHMVELGELVEQEVQQLLPAAERKGLQLVYQPSRPPVPSLSLDVSKTRQVIMNFIDNAIYYTPVGTVTIRLEPAGDRVRFTVTDTGIGVPEAEKPRLFAKFYRAENARLTRPDGTGLGLYLAKQVIEDQGGRIIFESVEGQGSTFGFELPATLPASPAPNPAPTSPAPTEATPPAAVQH